MWRFLVTAVVIFSIMAPIGLIIGIILSAYGGDGNLDGPMTIIEAVATGERILFLDFNVFHSAANIDKYSFFGQLCFLFFLILTKICLHFRLLNLERFK